MSDNKKSKTLLAAAISLVIAGQASVASAGSLTIEEIVVTTTKRLEALQDVSVSVSTVDTEFMQIAGISDIEDVSMHVPSLTVSTNSSPWNTSFRMRRIGNEGNIPTFEPDTGLFIDGAFRSRSGLGLGDLVDIERIEVLKGPQSTLYGKNVTAGLISVTTKAPTEDFEAMLEGSVGEDDLYVAKGFVSGGLAENVFGRLTFSHSEHDALMDNASGEDANELNSTSLRGQLVLEPSEDLAIQLTLGAVERDFNGLVGEPEFSTTAQAVFAQAQRFPTISNATPLADNKLGNYKIDYHPDTSTFNQESYEFIATVDYYIGDVMLTSISSYDEYDVVSHQQSAAQSPIDILSFRDDTSGYSWSQEFRLTGESGDSLEWITGIFAYHNNFQRGTDNKPEFVMGADIEELGFALLAPNLTTQLGADPIATSILLGSGNPIANGLGVAGDTGDFYNEQDTDTFGIFGQFTWSITADLSMTAGLRYSYEEKDATLITSYTNSPLATAAAPAFALPLAAPGGLAGLLAPDNSWAPDDSWDAITGNVTLEYHVNDDVMIYGTLAHGFKAGGFNLGFGTLPNEQRPFDEETVDTLEFGWKTQFYDNRLQVNGSVFHTEYTDFQSAAFQGLTFLVNNAEQVDNTGVEFDGLFLVSESISVNFAVSYVIAEYDEYTRGSCYIGRAPDSATQADKCDLSGEELPFAPRWKANSGIQYEAPMGAGDFYSRVDIAWVGKHNPSSELDPRHKQSDYAMGNVKLGWRTENLDVSLWSKNFTDQSYAIQYAPDNLMSGVTRAGSHQGFFNDPRSTGVTVRYDF
ncbi:TonB-dependent receptor [Oceanicoccus sp. KOV_DT_Chl]|uniref:TonB-dependent receptor n=1 Tax=Oceanicoccus sp. KOV_DT_Chl TaxID=1904639 RepID=UPI000C7E21CF|nr:TonB-dependent receptor [Oceanicoccus sp. KOV_DT_Chl]